MITLVPSHAEKTFLEDAVLAVPEGQREAKALMVVGYAGDTVLAPAIRATTGVLMREMCPGVAVVRVVLANRRLIMIINILSNN